MQIETSMQYHLIPISIATIKRQKLRNTGDGVEKTPMLQVRMKISTPTVENSMEIA